MLELHDLVEHFAIHVATCVEHLGADGFEARFTRSDTGATAIELINRFLDEYNHRVKGDVVDSEGLVHAHEIVLVKPTSPTKSLLDYFPKAGPSTSRTKSQVANDGEEVKSAEDQAAS